MNRVKKWISYVLVFGLMSATLISCGGGGETPNNDAEVTKKMGEVVKAYSSLVYKSYQDVEKGVVELKGLIDTFVATPTAAGLDAAKKKWLAVRDIYGQTEGYRFYGGPIDDDRGIEGRINAWPLDENFIDYVDGDDNAGIINDPTTYPTIDKKTLMDANENGGDKNISLGWHAIEFLLWGQDKSKDGPGTRPHTDYLKEGGTAANQERRGQYLKLAAEILLEDIRTVMNDWKPDDANNYRGKFEAMDPKEALTKILTGIGTLSGGEVSGERLSTPYKEKDQEEEHSCFSDNTKADMVANSMSAQNVYLATFGTKIGASIDELVRMKDTALADQLKAELQASVDAAKAIPTPFDNAILGDDTADGRVKVKATIDALQKQTQTIAAVGKLFGITVNTELP